MRGKRIKKKKNNISKIISLLFLLFFIFTMIFSGIKILEWVKENIARNKILDDIQNTVSINAEKDNVEKYNIDFANLKEKNSDTVAWFKINGTNIEYPVVKAKDNEYYLTHSFDKTYNTSGWAFMDYKNRCDGKDQNMVIYGHNRRDGGMFGSLKNVLNKEWYDNKENYIIPFITENRKEEYQVFSVYSIEKEDYYITTNFANDNEFKTFIDKIKSRSNKDFNVEVTTDDKILTVSTCANNNKYRVVLHAKRIK